MSKYIRRMVVCNLSFIDEDEILLRINDRLFSIKNKYHIKPLDNGEVIVECDVKYDNEGNICKIKNVNSLSGWNKQYLKVEGFNYNGEFIRFKEPFTVEIVPSEGLFDVVYEPLGIITYSDDYRNLSDEIEEYLSNFTYKVLALSEDNELTEDARAIKYKILDMIE